MVMFTMVNGRTIKLMALVFTITLTVQDMKVNGSKTNNMVKVKKFGPTTPATRANTKMERSMVMVNSYGLMVQPILVISSITTFTALAFILGLMDVSMMESGTTIRCMDAECSLGLMVAATKEITLTIKSKVLVFSLGPMVVNTMANGKMENSTVSALTIPVRAKLRKVNGLMANASNGLKVTSENCFKIN